MAQLITGAQIRMARGYLRWSVEQLAEQAGIGVSTVKRMEADEGVPSSSTRNLMSVATALEKAGIEFLNEGDRCGILIRAGSK